MKHDNEDICFSVDSSDAPTDFLTPAATNIYEQPAEQSQVSTAYMEISIVKVCLTLQGNFFVF
jgi:hypothetical protein